MNFDFLPAPLHRAGLRLAHRLRRVWWRWRKPRVLGCSIMLFDAERRVLLVRHSYGRDHWALPGGAIGGGENPADAVRRELLEEVGCGVNELVHFDSASSDLHGATNVVEMFLGLADGQATADGREIVEARFFSLDALPAPLGLATAQWLTEYRKRC